VRNSSKDSSESQPCEYYTIKAGEIKTALMDRAGDSGGSANPALSNSILNLVRKESKTNESQLKALDLEMSNLSEEDFVE